MKKCSKCRNLLKRSAFNKDKSRKDGLQNKCKQCQGHYYLKGRDRYLQVHTLYRETHREHRRRYQRKYDVIHREEKRARDQKWQRQNPERCRAKSHRRRAKIANLPYDLTSEEWQTILAEYNFSCAYCGETTENLQQEHVVPVAQGGGYTKDNIVPACSKCNFRKGNRTPEEAGVQLRGLARP